MNVPRGLTDLQYQFQQDKTRFIQVVCGRRSRKTLISRWKLMQAALANPKHRYFAGAPTLPQAREIFWDKLKDDLQPFFARKPDETYLKIYLVNGTLIQVVGLQKGERIEGREWHGGIITEFDNVPKGVFEMNVSPALSDTGGWCIIEGVPEGRAALYSNARMICGGSVPKPLPIKGAYRKGRYDKNPEKDLAEWAYYSWLSSDVLPAKEIASAKARLDERSFKQEYEASFDSAGGLAYYAFGVHNEDRSLKLNPRRKVYIGMDFNVDPMTAVLCHAVMETRTIQQFGEIYLPSSNTGEMIEAIKDLVSNNGMSKSQVTIVPDATGAARQTNALDTDIALIRQAGFTVFVDKSNPRQRERLTSINSAFLSSDGKNIRYFINPDSCPKTIRDFQEVGLHPDGRIDKSLEYRGIGHISDGAGYLTHKLFPIRQSEIRGV